MNKLQGHPRVAAGARLEIKVLGDGGYACTGVFLSFDAEGNQKGVDKKWTCPDLGEGVSPKLTALRRTYFANITIEFLSEQKTEVTVVSRVMVGNEKKSEDSDVVSGSKGTNGEVGLVKVMVVTK
jgi:hypothetical protein